MEPAVDPSHKDFQSEKPLAIISHSLKIPDDGYRLVPNKLVLAWTHEYINLLSHNRVAARIEGKSSLARLGLGVHVTAPTIHAGFGAGDQAAPGSPIQLEIFNLGPCVIRLDRGMPICQLIFEEMREVPTTGYQGQFSNQ